MSQPIDSPSENPEDLAKQVAGTSAKQLREGFEKQEGLTSKDREIEDKDKDDDYNFRKTWKNIKCWAAWISAILVGVIVLTLCVFASFLIFMYAQNISHDAGAIKEAINNGKETVLTVLATLFIEHAIRSKK